MRKKLFLFIVVLLVSIPVLTTQTAQADKACGNPPCNKEDTRPAEDPGEHQGDHGRPVSPGKPQRPPKNCDKGEPDSCGPTPIPPTPTPEPTETPPKKKTPTPEHTPTPTEVSPTETPEPTETPVECEIPTCCPFNVQIVVHVYNERNLETIGEVFDYLDERGWDHYACCTSVR